jgi:hypothetical protein
MLNNNTVVRNSYSTNTNISMNPPCNGTLQRTHIKSQFLRCHVESVRAGEIFDFEPHINKAITKQTPYGPHNTKERIDIVVLQVMCFGDNELLIEYVKKDDY